MARNWRSADPRRGIGPVVVVGALVALATATAAVGPAATAPRPAAEAPTYLVTAAPGRLDDLVARLDAHGITVERSLDSLDMAVVAAPLDALSGLAADGLLVGVSPDDGVALAADGFAPYDPTTDSNSMYSVNEALGSREAWSGKKRATGLGVGVAVVDSGISPVPGLDAPGKIVNGVDLSFDADNPQYQFLDGFGHGTHMAGIIAGRDAGADPGNRGDDPNLFVGIAPDAHLVNVKVADATGAVDVSQIVAGIDWVIAHRNDPGLNIRVLNLSLGTPSAQSYLDDPLAYAAERAWLAGIVVVVSVGNDGTGTGRVFNPAIDPYVIAVGADDTRGTKTTNDDRIPDFSSRGDGTRNPDLVAHGTSVQSLRVPGSFIDLQFGATASIDDRFIRGSGTSQAAAAVSGAVAVLLELRPTLTPDQVKALLMDNARKLPKAHSQAQGQGLIDLRSLDKKVPGKSEQKFARSTGRGSLDAARGGYYVTADDGTVLSGEIDAFGNAYVPSTGDAVDVTPPGWKNSPWKARTWAGGSWQARTWAGGYWSARTWAGDTWSSRTWAGGGWG